MSKEHGSSDVSFKLRYADPGMFVELFAPAEYEDLLRDVLEKGYDPALVRRYLLDPANQEQIRSLLAEDEDLRDYDRQQVEQMTSRLLTGFSVYRGEGSFASTPIARDPILVVRLLFLPPLEEWFGGELGVQADHGMKAARIAARRYLRHYTHDVEEYLAANPDLDSLDRQTVLKLKQWLDSIGLTVYGYVVHSLCREMTWREKHLGIKTEDEIWVGSLRSLAVNKVVRV